MKLYKSGLALKREGTDETVAAFINEQDLDNVLEAVMTKKKPNKPVPGDEETIIEAIASRAQAKKMGMNDVVETIDYMMELVGVALEEKQDGTTKWTRVPVDEAESMAIPSIAFLENVFQGDPPAPHASWNNWMAEATQSGVISGVTIRQAAQSDYAQAGMPSAARDAAYDEIAALAVQWGDARVPDGGGNALRNFAEHVLKLKSIAGPVADDGISPIYRWLEQAASTDISEVSHAARTMMAFYQGAESPAPVQQAAPSELLTALSNLYAMTAKYAISDADYVHVANAASAIAAAPAQPVGLSEQDRLDAARYRWLIEQFGGGLSIDLDCGRCDIGETIDAAILAAKEAP